LLKKKEKGHHLEKLNTISGGRIAKGRSLKGGGGSLKKENSSGEEGSAFANTREEKEKSRGRGEKLILAAVLKKREAR